MHRKERIERKESTIPERKSNARRKVRHFRAVAPVYEVVNSPGYRTRSLRGVEADSLGVSQSLCGVSVPIPSPISVD
jgi:hypothetical protein